MLRSILIGLDGSAHSRTALSLGIDWARRSDALLVGLGIIDEPTIRGAETLLVGGQTFADPILYRERMADARRQVEQFLEQFALQCAEAGVAAKVLEDVGMPAEEIVLEAQRYDLVLLGQQTRFHFETHEDCNDTLCKVLKSSPRPVVVVPAVRHEGGPVLVAYDGSLQAAEALSDFQATGLAGLGLSPVQIVSIASDHSVAARNAERAVDYLRFHEIRAESCPIVTGRSTSETLLEQIRLRNAGLVVMGAYGQSSLREFFLGSVTRSLLEDSPVPLFLSR
jgi:nucleotide-binding universal stress UspA family protein